MSNGTKLVKRNEALAKLRKANVQPGVLKLLEAHLPDEIEAQGDGCFYWVPNTK